MNFYHTVGDTEPFIIRLTRNSNYEDLTACTVTFQVTALYKSSPFVIDQPMTVHIDQVLHKGEVKYDWQVADASIPKGLYQAKIIVDYGGGIIKSFPTQDFGDEFIFFTFV